MGKNSSESANGLPNCGKTLRHDRSFNKTVPFLVNKIGVSNDEACASLLNTPCSLRGINAETD